ncbi:putative transcription factor/ chromatin remodeling BED-type(Zn) family [Helianthus annuus]|uniref:Transcription factor/ chromatin remodeling BED-type(Zn) family n=2 Tax=Helianthus annuus TaxID=4232 RepID=A0A9K3I4A9_HELAN|nr:glutamic acid-rich protein [Helianthus annuus]KAF5789479.1 putative transcription factor/ chromatin remodeling BED-type(Zn) family [Helianthus annuus]KAJ0891783.1 putative transcription factor/ chromatin remodeling BED-type(Zn) family [Helianthus annuus]
MSTLDEGNDKNLVPSDQGHDETSSNWRRRPRAHVWAYFERITGEDGLPKQRCTTCNKVYAIALRSGTSTLRRHLRKCAPQLLTQFNSTRAVPYANSGRSSDEMSEEVRAANVNQPTATNFDPKHNICCVLDKESPKMKPFVEMVPFIERSRIKKAVTDQCPAYRTHIETFWMNAKFVDSPPRIHSVVKDGNVDKEVVITEALIREVLAFGDKPEDPTGYSERMVKGCFMRMGYKGHVNTPNFLKSSISRPYKFLMHVVIHAFGHTRKSGYDIALDYIMCMIVALTLNLPYNFSKVIFTQMKDNLTPNGWLLMYPRFVQMLLNHLLPNLEKKDDDLLKLEHMNDLSRINRYKKQAEVDIPKFKRLIGALGNENYVAPPKDKWRNDGSDSDNEDKQMEGFKERRSKWFIKDEKPKKAKKQTKRKRASRIMLRDESEEDDLICAISEIAKDIEDEVLQRSGSGEEADNETTESEEMDVLTLNKPYSVMHDSRTRAEKKAAKSKKKQLGDDDDDPIPVRKMTGRKKSKALTNVKKTGSFMAKKARKAVEELSIETTAGAEPAVTKKSALIIEEEMITPASQQTPTPPISPQPQAQQRQQPEQTGPSSATSDRDFMFDGQPFLNGETMEYDLFRDTNDKKIKCLKVTKDLEEDKKLKRLFFKDRMREIRENSLNIKLKMNLIIRSYWKKQGLEAEFDKNRIKIAEARAAEKARKAVEWARKAAESEPAVVIIDKGKKTVDATPEIVLEPVKEKSPERVIEKDSEPIDIAKFILVPDVEQEDDDQEEEDDEKSD